MDFEILAKYLPASSHEYIQQLLTGENLLIRITRQRKTRFGSFTARRNSNYKAINISGQQNQWAFLITFIHEFAHLRVWKTYGHKVKGHGREWKDTYYQLATPLLLSNTFPEDINEALKKYFTGKKISDSTETNLMRILKKYDSAGQEVIYIENIPVGHYFTYGNHQFQKIEKLRTRYKCKDVKTGRMFVFTALVEVNPINN